MVMLVPGATASAVRTPLKATAATMATSARSAALFQPAMALMRLFFKISYPFLIGC